MTVMIQASPRDAAGTLYNIKSEGDEPDITWADFGSLLVSIGGTELAQKVRATLASVLLGAPGPAPAPADPLVAAQAVVQNTFPGAAPVGEQWGNPPVPPMVPAAAAAQAAPAQPAVPVCQHGPKSLVSSKPGAPRPWQFWGCNARSDDPTKCEKEWVR